nr:NADH dehydrogenase subunit 6 [Heterochaerus australis]
MIKSFFFFWMLSTFYSTFPGVNPLTIIFSIILLSTFLFITFSFKGGSSMGFLWILVYLGGMLIVFLYLIFLISSSEVEEKNSFNFQFPFSLFLFFIFFKMLFNTNLTKEGKFPLSMEFQEFYSLILTTSCAPIFSFLIAIISVSLFLFLGILNKKMMQSKISIFFFFIMKSM